MVHPIYTELTECRDCYKCVRSCPVKSIQVKDGRAVVVHDRCICCGRCVDTCPSHAKKIRNDVSRAKRLLASRGMVVASIAPSYATEFPDHAEAVLVALQKLGFGAVSETALGAALVSAAVDMHVRQSGGSCSWISTACPVVVEMVHRYQPECFSRLAPIPSPLQCHSVLLRQLYGQDIGIVFIGPCIAKKIEADNTPGYPDIALTFRELRAWFEEQGIDLGVIAGHLASGCEVLPPLVPALAGETTYYPVDGGMIASLAKGRNKIGADAVSVSGSEAVMQTLSLISDGSAISSWPGVENDFLELLSCEGGCVNGPGTTHRLSAAVKKSISARFTSMRIDGSNEVFVPPQDLVQRILTEGYSLLRGDNTEPSMKLVPSPVAGRPGFSDQAIESAMVELGKQDPSERLDCGGCGYNSCREMAIAYLEGMAEPEMCVTKMRKLAQSKIDVLLRTLPMGVVIVDSTLRIVDCNTPFLQLFGDVGDDIEDDILDLMAGLPLQRFVPFHDRFANQLDSNAMPTQVRIQYHGKFLDVLFFSVEKHRMAGALFQDVTNPTVRRETVVKHAEAVIQKSLSTVQQIASLLGENAAETEIMLSSLIEAFQVPDQDEHGLGGSGRSGGRQG